MVKKLGKIILLVFASMIMSGGSVFALDVSIDTTLSWAADVSGNGMGSTNGYGIGINLFPTEDPVSDSFITRAGFARFVTRIDIGYYRWSKNTGYAEWSYVRVPVFAGARLFILRAPRVYIEGGIDVSYDRAESIYTGPLYGIFGNGYRAAHSEIVLGLTPGAGIEFPLGKQLTAGVNSRLNIYTGSSYLTIGASIGYHF